MFLNLKKKPFFNALILSIIVHAGVVGFFLCQVKVASESLIAQYEIMPINQFSDESRFLKSNQGLRKKSENQLSANFLSSNIKQSQTNKPNNSSLTNVDQSSNSETGNVAQIEPPKIQNKVVFNRTNQARAARFEGDSKLKIKINKSGDITSAELLNSLPYGLDERSLEIAQSLKLTPAYLAGVAIDYEFIFTIRYRNE